MPRKGKQSVRVYQGRFKGSTETHMPNDKFREQYDKMKKDCGCPFGGKCVCNGELSEVLTRTERTDERTEE
jgi:hypothetical protein